MKTETKPMKLLRIYRWLRSNGYEPKTARASALLQTGYSLGLHWNYWKIQ